MASNYPEKKSKDKKEKVSSLVTGILTDFP